MLGKFMRDYIITSVLTDPEYTPKEQQWQEHATPFHIVDKMIEKTDVRNKRILVLFNMEFIEQLIHKYGVPVENIRFMSDNAFEKRVAEDMYDVSSAVCPKKNWQKLLTRRATSMGFKKFDLVFSNPPYNRGIDLKIMQSLSKIVDELVVVHPSTWLIDLKGKSKLFNGTKALFAGSLKSTTLFNGNPVFGIGLFVPCVISHIDNKKEVGAPIDVDFFGRKFRVSNIDDITNFGPEWEAIVKPFMTKMKAVVADTGSLWDHNVKEIDDSKFHCQLAAIRGNVYIGGGPDVIVQDDFHTLVMKDSDKNKGIRQPNLNKPGGPTPTFAFDSEVERDNFISYLKTDFVRFCLSLLKMGQHVENGEMILIPMLDFKEEWTDEKLFEYFGVDEQTQQYIKNFLPDYYGLEEEDAQMV